MNNKLKNLKTIVFDFDGVLTNNKVLIDENGKEWVQCNRSDGLAMEILKKQGMYVIILSSEKNKVVLARGRKLGVKTYNNCKDKLNFLKKLQNRGEIDLNTTLYVGNDINDFEAMRACEVSACPKDSHSDIKKISKYILEINGGDGVARYLVDMLFKVKFNSIKV